MLATKTKDQVLSQIIENTWQDPTFREKFLESPKEILSSLTGVNLPENLNIHILEETSDDMYIIIPKNPYSERNEISLKSLESISGNTKSGCLAHTCSSC